MISACTETESPEPLAINYKQEMKDFVQDLSTWSKSFHPSFIIVPQNGHELITKDGRPQSNPDLSYLNAIDGVSREDLFFGYHKDDQESPYDIQSDVAFYLAKARLNENTILVTDYCSTPSKVDTSYARNTRNRFISFAASHRALDNIPDYPSEPVNMNNKNILKLDSIKNYLYLVDPESLGSKSDFINAVKSTNFDLLITDLFFDGKPFTPNETEQLRQKANGGTRLLLSYLSIGEAENYRYYWKHEWNTDKPEWMKAENPNWPGNFKVAYWEKDWQDIIFGNRDSYLKKIIDAGFDGAWLDIIDAFEYFEENREN
jgi:cysteinyl-tRNA synthetase